MTRAGVPDNRIAIGAGLALVTLAGLIALGAVLTRSTPQSTDAAQVPGPNEVPLAGGIKMTVDSAVQTLSVPMYRPSTSVASDASIRDVWVDPGPPDQELYLRYQSGIVLKVSPAGDALSNEVWAAELARDGIEGSMQTVAGVQTFFVAQEGSSHGSARFFLGRALVTFIGEGDFTVDDLRMLVVSTVQQAEQAQAEKATT